MRLDVIAHWGVVAAATLAVWSLGSDSVSLEATSRIIRPSFLEWLFPALTPAQREIVHIYIRKLAHVAEYGALAVLVLRAWLVTRTMPRLQAVALAVGYVLLLGAADEARQAASSRRKGAAFDVALDVAGACAAITVAHGLPPRGRRVLLGEPANLARSRADSRDPARG
jgi:VanZ family protein